MKKDDFKLEENVQLITYSYDDQGNEYSREVKGKICQITNYFIVLDNGNYKESFKYCDFQKCTPGTVENEPYDLSLESYSEDIISNCIRDITSGKEGIVFNNEQLDKVFSKVNKKHYSVKKANEIYYINKI